MNGFWKLLTLLLIVFAVLATFRIMDNIVSIKNLDTRLSELENSKGTISIFVERYYNSNEGQHEYRVVNVVETPDILAKAH